LAAREKPVLVRGGRCLPFGSSVVYWPLSEMVRAECSIAEGDPSELAWQKLSGRLAPLLAPDADEELVRRRIAPIAQLVGIELPGAEDPGRAREDEQSAREAFFGGVRAFVEAIAQDEPLVLAWEDIHWADEGRLDQRGRAPGHGAGAAGRALGLARAARARAGLARGGRWTHLLGGRAGSGRRSSWRGAAGGARDAARQGPDRSQRWRRPRRRAGARVQARADPRRRLLDAAQGGTRAQALRGWQVHRGGRRRAPPRGGGVAGRALRAR